MLGKLFKYEIKATARLFIPLYLTIVVFAAINRFFLTMPNIGDHSFSFQSLAMALSMFVYATLMVGLVVMTLFVLIQRFYKNLLGDEGYLMFTLPVQAWKHILSKLVISMLWIIASGIIACCSILIIASKNIHLPELFSKLAMAYDQYVAYFGASSYLISLEAFLLALLTLASTILSIYAAIALGHLFSKYKLLASFGMYILIKTAAEIIMAVFAAIFFNTQIFQPNTAFIPSDLLVNGMLLFSISFTGLFAAGYFYLTNYLLKKKLNLE